jgi:hypothetical protein
MFQAIMESMRRQSASCVEKAYIKVLGFTGLIDITCPSLGSDRELPKEENMPMLLL